MKTNMASELIPGLTEDVAMECLLRVPRQCFSNLRMVCRRWKEEIESPIFHLRRRSAGFASSFLVFLQDNASSRSLTVLDPAAGKWDALPAIPGLRYGLYPLCGLASVGQELVVVGCVSQDEDWLATPSVYIYSFISGTWRRGRPMPSSRRRYVFACASDGGSRVSVVGWGINRIIYSMRSELVYDVARDEWTPLLEMETERHSCSAGGMIQVAGDYVWPTHSEYESPEAFNFGQFRWRPLEVAATVIGSKLWKRVSGGDGRTYICKRGTLEVAAGPAGWMAVAELPEDVGMRPHLMACEGSLVVAGKDFSLDPLVVYVMDVMRRRGSAAEKWRRLEVPPEYSGYIHDAVCCMVI